MKISRSIIFIVLLLIISFFSFGVIFFKNKLFKSIIEENIKKKEKIFKVVTTTGMIADIINNIAKNYTHTISLMGPGIDPHTYKATPRDLQYLKNADLIFYNGLHLEGKMGNILDSFNKIKPTIVASDGLDHKDIIRDKEFSEGVDPHIWFDVLLWMKVVNFVSSVLQEKLPKYSKEIHDNTKIYIDELKQLHNYITKTLNKVSNSQRVLITAHDAFGYFGRAYNIKVKGLQGISTTAEYGLKDVKELVNFIVKNKIKAIFLETSVAEKPIKKVIEDCKSKNHILELGGPIYSDAMGPKNSSEGSYIGMMKKNVDIITEYLS